MVFSELRFFLFLLIVLAVHWAIPSNRWRKIWLLASSYAFYSIWDWRFSFLIFFSSAIDYSIGQALSRTETPFFRKSLVAISVGVNLGLLGFFKYFNFFADSFVEFMSFFGLEATPVTLKVILPVGISFYTFQTMSYTLDLYRNQVKAVRSFTDFSLFVAFFPQLVAGPIVRARDFLPQLCSTRCWSRIPVQPLLGLFLVGFFKKACLSDNLSPYVDACFSDPNSFGALSIWLAIVLYAIQIYCDFSGYSDMAIAISGLLGYQLPKNFDAPYFASSVVDFWRRWHISLSTWLRDYLYIPIGGNRFGTARTYCNLMLTMLLGGLWHGASWNFIFWGALHGFALVVNRISQEYVPSLRNARWLIIPSTLLTFWWVNLAWILFRTPDIQTFKTMALAWSLGISQGTNHLPMVLWIHVSCLAVIHWLWRRTEVLEMLSSVPRPIFAFIYGVLAACMLAVASNSYQPFIYFQF